LKECEALDHIERNYIKETVVKQPARKDKGGKVLEFSADGDQNRGGDTFVSAPVELMANWSHSPLA